MRNKFLYMKHLLAILFLLLNIFSFSQDLEKRAENLVSATTKVFTYKVLNDTLSNVQDSQSIQKINPTQKNIIKQFLAIEGVNQASYDRATGTYTVVTKIATKLAKKITFD